MTRWANTPADATKYKFTGKERDAETALDYFEARHYSSSHGRFLSSDQFTGGPVELFVEISAVNPTFYGDISEPQSNENRQLSAEEQLAKAKEKLAEARKVTNKTKKQAAEVEKLKEQVKHWQRKVAEKSEEHARQAQGR